jgi:hypothetical protein
MISIISSLVIWTLHNLDLHSTVDSECRSSDSTARLPFETTDMNPKKLAAFWKQIILFGSEIQGLEVIAER